MVNIVNLKTDEQMPWQSKPWLMIAARAGLGVKAWGASTTGPDALRWDTGWLTSFDEAMKRARELAAEHGADTIYIQAGADDPV